MHQGATTRSVTLLEEGRYKATRERHPATAAFQDKAEVKDSFGNVIKVPTPKLYILKRTRSVLSETRDPRPETRDLKAKPETRKPEPETRNPTPEIRNPKHEARQPKSENRISKSETRSPSSGPWRLC